MADGSSSTSVRHVLSALGMLLALPPAVMASTLSPLLEGVPQRLVSTAGGFCLALSFVLGLAALSSAIGPAGRLTVLLLPVVVAAAIAFVPAAGAAYGAAAGAWLGAFLIGGWSARLLAALVPLAWLWLFTALWPWRAARLAARAVAVLVLGLVTAASPALVDGATGRFARRLWPAAAEAAGKPVPELTLTDVDGATRSLSEFRGKIILINVWRTW